MHLSLIGNRPGAIRSSNTLTKFTLSRYVRIRLQSMHTTMDNFEWTSDRQSLEMRSFYSIRTIQIGARVMCSGHASKTQPVTLSEKGSNDQLKNADDNDDDDEITVEPSELEECLCLHNTCGMSCEKCCPLFNQRSFRMGTEDEENACEKCQV